MLHNFRVVNKMQPGDKSVGLKVTSLVAGRKVGRSLGILLRPFPIKCFIYVFWDELWQYFHSYFEQKRSFLLRWGLAAADKNEGSAKAQQKFCNEVMANSSHQLRISDILKTTLDT